MVKIITVFNNKGGVGKTTLTYHLAHALGEMGKKVLLMDLDPQCNLTIVSLTEEKIHNIWLEEDDYIDDFAGARRADEKNFNKIVTSERTVHFLLKPTEDGTDQMSKLSPPVKLTENVHLLPGRLTLHLYESKLAERWSGIYQGDPLAINTGTRIRQLAHEYAKEYKYDIVIIDTSPSLGALNRNILTLADGFLIPCAPDLFSVYGIRNIGQALNLWRKQYDTIFQLLSDSKRAFFPKDFVKLMGYTIYNAKKRTDAKNELGIAGAHSNFANQIPDTIKKYIDQKNALPYNKILSGSIGGNAIIYGHNTFPAVAQKYHQPMWKLPDQKLDKDDVNTVKGNQQLYRNTREYYNAFAKDFWARLEHL